MSSSTLLRDYIYTNSVGVTLLVYLLGCGRPRIANGQKPDTPLFLMWLTKIIFVRLGVFDGHKIVVTT